MVLPAYNCADYLAIALAGVVEQLKDTDAEIIVVDDASVDDAAGVVERVGQGRVRFERNEPGLGAVRNFNHCLDLASGDLVHLLHADDAVLPGFYDAMASAMDGDAVAAVCRTRYVDGAGTPGAVTRSLRQGSGVWDNALPAMVVSNRVRPSGIVVRRSAYEQVGGFRTDLPHAADWEMWTRLCATGEVTFVDDILALYRRHGASDTAARIKSGVNIRERVTAIDLVAQFLPEAKRDPARRKALVYSTAFAARVARDCLRDGEVDAARHQAMEGVRCLLMAARPSLPALRD